MRVLMLGWEFPPHISGGLGTACQGMTQGLAHQGVEVLFVIPRAMGDEDKRSAQVLGCNEVPIARFRRPSKAARGAVDGRRTSQGVHADGTTVVEKVVTRKAGAKGSKTIAPDVPVETLLELLEIDSPLRPYLDAEIYEKVVTELKSTSKTQEAASEQPSEETRISSETMEAVRELRALLQPDLASSVDAASPSTPQGAQYLSFSGQYGPDLFAEVARYAIVVGEIARREKFDVIHAHDWMTFPAGIVASRISKKPLVCHVHACEYDRSGENIDTRIRGLEQLGVDYADRIVPVSHYTASVLRRRYGAPSDKLRVVHNAVTHNEQIEEIRWQKNIEEPIVLFLGRVTFQKGPDYFIEAAARVLKVEPNVKFVMSGSGDMLPRMIERAARLGIARSIHFTGFLRGPDVERMYAMADLYVMPSVSEPFGISPLEAMALDVPVIVSRQSGVSEILKSALKVDFWDVDDLANKILGLLRYPALSEQLSEEGRDEVRRIRWEASGQALKQVYAELVP